MIKEVFLHKTNKTFEALGNPLRLKIFLKIGGALERENLMDNAYKTRLKEFAQR